MPSFSSLSLKGHHDQPLGNSFVRQDGPADHLALIFPGFAYGVDAPLLYYTRQVLLALGADVLGVETNYYRQAGFRAARPDERAAWIAADAKAALDAGLAQRAYKRITLAGKSVGTKAVGYLAAEDPRVKSAGCLWLTPLFDDEELSRQVIRGGQRGLFVAGTADELYDAGSLARLLAAVGGEKLIVEGADHSLELPGDVPGSVRVLEQLVEAEHKFLTK